MRHLTSIVLNELDIAFRHIRHKKYIRNKAKDSNIFTKETDLVSIWVFRRFGSCWKFVRLLRILLLLALDLLSMCRWSGSSHLGWIQRQSWQARLAQLWLLGFGLVACCLTQLSFHDFGYCLLVFILIVLREVAFPTFWVLVIPSQQRRLRIEMHHGSTASFLYGLLGFLLS